MINEIITNIRKTTTKYIDTIVTEILLIYYKYKENIEKETFSNFIQKIPEAEKILRENKINKINIYEGVENYNQNTVIVINMNFLETDGNKGHIIYNSTASKEKDILTKGPASYEFIEKVIDIIKAKAIKEEKDLRTYFQELVDSIANDVLEKIENKLEGNLKNKSKEV